MVQVTYWEHVTPLRCVHHIHPCFDRDRFRIGLKAAIVAGDFAALKEAYVMPKTQLKRGAAQKIEVYECVFHEHFILYERCSMPLQRPQTQLRKLPIG